MTLLLRTTPPNLQPANMANEPLPRDSHAAVGFGQKLYIWGGYGKKVETSTVESFDVSSEKWEQPRLFRGAYPDGLYCMGVTTEGKIAYSYGGRTDVNPDPTRFNTLYQIDLSTFKCKELVPVSAPFNAPPKTSGGRIVCFDQRLVVHGGRTNESRTDEVHVFDLRTNMWSPQPTTGEKPPPVALHTFTKIDHHRAVVFGGYTGSRRLNDTYVLDTETWQWTKLDISGAKPSPRSLHAICCIAGPLTGQQYPVLLMVGGYNKNSLRDVWLLDVDRGVWREVILPEAITVRRSHSADVFGCGPNFRIVVLFGGGKSNRSGDEISETTLLLLELREGSWQVTRVVKPDELGQPDERLREQMQKLEISPTPPPTSGATKKTSPIIDVNEIQMGERLGQGGFGAVFEAKWKKKKVAVKVCLGNLLQNLSREIQILTSLPSHPHVIKFYGAALSSDSVSTYIITELASNGSLYNYLHIKGAKPSPDQSFAWALQVASGMQHLHANNVVHRDLKSGNILLSFGLLAKVCDFGTARTLAKTAMTTQKGTYRWMAPEIMEGVEAKINKMCDVFSFGMVLYEIFACKLPYGDIPTDPLVGMAVLQGKRPPIPRTLPSFLHPLLKDCWMKEPDQRPQFDAIVLAIETESYE